MSHCTNSTASINQTGNISLCLVEELPKLSWWVGFVENTYLGMIIAIGVPGNILILLTHRRNRDKTSTDYLIAAMASNELLGSSFNSLMKIIMNTDLWKYIASDEFCRFLYVTLYIVGFASPYLLAAIALDRYFKTCHPLKTIISIRTSKILCWGLSFLALLTGATTPITFEMHPTTKDCVIAEKYIQLQLNWDMGVICSTAIVFLIYIFSYISIVIALNKRVRLRQQRLGKTRVSLWSEITKKIRERRIHAAPITRINVAMINDNDTDIKPQTTDKAVHGPKEREDKNKRVSNMGETIYSVSRQLGKGSADRDSETTGTTILSLYPSQSSSHITGKAQTPNEPTKNETIAKGNYQAPPGRRSQTSIEQSANRTTLIMFLLTLIYAITYAVVNTCVMTTHTVLGPIMEKLCKSLLLVNCISNPILFFCMSSKYRHTAKDLLKKILPC